MESPTLGNIFTKHLGFPAHRGAALGAEGFADRMATRVHAFVPEKNDPEAWVEHFFELDHPLEDRQKELEAIGAADHAPAVLEFELGENEFVVIDDEDEVVVVSDRGSIVLSNTSELRTRLSAAQLPASQSSPTAAFKSQGDRAFYVTQSGRVMQLDAKLVARAIQSAPTPKVEPLARVAAPSRLAAFSPVQRRETPRPASHATETVRSVARAESKGTSTSPQVVVVEKNNAKAVSGQTARFWQKMASALTAGGRQSENLGRSIPGASAVALGRQTYAVKAGGVTALVHRPVAGLGTRAEAAATRAGAAERRASTGSRWVRDALAEKPAGNGFWIQPAVAQSTVGVAKPQWVERALSQARDLRSRAREEAQGRLDPKPVSAAPQVRAAAGVFAPKAAALANARIDFANLGAIAPVKLPHIAISEGAPVDFTLPEIRVHASSAWPDDAPRPLTSLDAMPATTLRALYTGLERTASAEGHRISSISLDVAPATRLESAPAGSTEAFVDARFGTPEVRTIEVETERISIAPAYYEAPFATDGGMRVGEDLSSTIDNRVMQRTVATESSSTWAPRVAVAAPAPERVRVSVPTPSTTVATIPSAVSAAMGAQAAPARLSALAWLDWAVTNAPYARAKTKDDGAAPAPARPASSGAAASAPSAPALASAPAAAASGSKVPSYDRIQAAFGSHDVSHVQAYTGASAAAATAAVGAQAYTGGARPAFAPGASAPVLAHESSHAVQQSAGRPALAIAGIAPEQATVGRGSDSIGGRPAGPEAMGVRPASPEAMGVRAQQELARPMTLTAVNAARAPEPAHASSASAAPGVEHVEIGVPLHVQMTEARQAAPAHALAESAPSVSLVPIVTTSTTTVDVGGHAPASSAPAASASRSSGTAVSLARPTGSFTAPASSAPASSASAGPVPAAAVSGSMMPDRAHRKARGEGEARLPAGAAEARPSGPAIPQRDAVESSFGSHDQAAVQVHSGSRPASVGAQAYTTGSAVHLDAPAMALATPAHESAHVVQQGASAPAASGSAPASASSAPRGAPASSAPSASAPASASGSAGPAAPASSRPSSGSAPASPAASKSASASSAAAPAAAGSAPASATSATSGRKGSGYLKFTYPAEARWWGPKGEAASAPAASASGSAPAATTVVTKRLDAPEGLAPASAADFVHAPASAAAPGAAAAPSTMSSPASYGARGARINGPAAAALPGSASTSSSSSSSHSASSSVSASASLPFAAGPAAAPHDGEMAYVAVAPTGEAKVVSKSAAATLQAQKKGGAAVDMTVVAGIAPQAPSVDDMALAGHERPHAKGKKEGGSKGAAGKTDSLSLQGTVDSLAQRIYHRLKRRLASDRERFGG